MILRKAWRYVDFLSYSSYPDFIFVMETFTGCLCSTPLAPLPDPAFRIFPKKSLNSAGPCYIIIGAN